MLLHIHVPSMHASPYKHDPPRPHGQVAAKTNELDDIKLGQRRLIQAATRVVHDPSWV